MAVNEKLLVCEEKEGKGRRSSKGMKLALAIVPLALAFLVTTTVIVARQLLQTSPSVARKVGYPMPVRVIVAEEMTLTESIGANGEAQPIALIGLSSRIAVPVQKVAVNFGDMVTAGQVLMQYDRELLKAAVATAQSGMAEASSAQERTLQQFRRIKASYEPGLFGAAMATVQSAVEQATRDLERSELYYQRIKTIYEQGLLPKLELEKAQAAIDEAKARQKQAEEKLIRAKKDLQLELEKAKAALDEAKFQYKQSEEKLIRAKKDLQAGSVVSPVAGIIMDRQINPGETPRISQPLFTIGQIDQILVEAQVSEDRLSDVHVKQAAIVTFTAFPRDTFEGEILKIKPVIDSKTRTFLVSAKVTNPGLKLKPGLSSFVRIKKEHHELAVPSIALINPTGLRESTLFVVEEGGIARLRKVQVGVMADGMTQIVHGLAPGEMVVTVGQMYLRDADQVRIGDEFEDVKAKLADAPQPHFNSTWRSN
jgi:multidrug efflux pump subunit AcrA (membrane-fusion protein)